MGAGGKDWRNACYVGLSVLTLVILGVAVAAALGFAVLLLWPTSESAAESDEHRHEDPPITDLFSIGRSA